MTFKLSMDTNGNQICQVKIPGERGFSIQTNGNLIQTNREGIGSWTKPEVIAHITLSGTERQKRIINLL